MIIFTGLGSLASGRPVAAQPSTVPDSSLADSSLTAALERRPAGQVNVGLQAGNTGGVTAKLYRRNLIAYDATLLTDGDDYLRILLHRAWERPLRGSPLAAYVGPGVVAGTEASARNRPLPSIGVGGIAGLNFYTSRFEVFLQVTPRVRFLPNRDEFLGASVGLRYAL